ncbi:MAG: hypothetical protein ACRDYE_09860 [Acidimicrobiales bacterium]
MSSLTWIGHHRLWALGMGAALLIVAVAAGVWFFVLRSPTTPIDLRQALRLYRQGQGPVAADPSPELPPSGVYRYRTSGSERLSMGDITRRFPTSTDLIVTDGRCATMKWEPFEQHIEGLVTCPSAGGALSITSAPSYEQIAGTQTTSDIQCPAAAYLLPPHPVAGQRWQVTCRAPGQTVLLTGQVIGTARVGVGGTSVPAVHTRMSLSFSGAESGSNPNDYWLSASTGLILRQSETVDVSQQGGPLGSVRYEEQMSMQLSSIDPMR